MGDLHFSGDCCVGARFFSPDQSPFRIVMCRCCCSSWILESFNEIDTKIKHILFWVHFVIEHQQTDSSSISMLVSDRFLLLLPFEGRRWASPWHGGGLVHGGGLNLVWGWPRQKEEFLFPDGRTDRQTEFLLCDVDFPQVFLLIYCTPSLHQWLLYHTQHIL